ncbi:MAG TPA: type II toxin-antitoxin system PemK/MazF family toxin [Candidatus Paceibacterota bacterium]
MEKDFDGWNLQKQQLDSSSSRFYTVREIWWCRLGLNIGTEQNGRGRKYFRPVVILRSFGRDACLTVPLTTSSKEHRYRVPIGLVGGKQAHANISQIRTIDTRRLGSKIGFLEKAEFLKLTKAVKDLL